MSPSASSAPIVNGTPSKALWDDIPSCIEAYARGDFLIVLDAAERENEGDLIIAARALTPAKAAFMIRHTSGYLCAPLSAVRAAAFELPLMVPHARNADPNVTAYTITVDAHPDSAVTRGLADERERAALHGKGVSTGISAHDRSVAARVLADARAGSADVRKPGHMIPLLVRDGGVRARRGHTEATWEFGRLAGVEPNVGVIGELVNDGERGAEDDGGVTRPEYHGAGMMRQRECLEFGRKWGIKCCTIHQLVEYVVEKEGPL